MIEKRIKIAVPASSANLGCGFDCAGIALNLWNEFIFEKSDVDKNINFPVNDDKNLVYSSFKYACKKFGKDINVKITNVKNNIPVSSGLGSSAACIVAGVVAANILTEMNFENGKLLEIMTEIEGHADNLTPAFLGGFQFCCVDNGRVYTKKYRVSKDLFFTVIFPNFEFSTKFSRGILPKEIPFKDAVSNLSKLALLPTALNSGNLDLVECAFEDKMHQPYRIPMLEEVNNLYKELKNKGFAVALSGAGPSLLVVGKEYVDVNNLKSFNKSWKVFNTKVSNFGVRVKDID